MPTSLAKNYLFPIAKSIVLFLSKRLQSQHLGRRPHDPLGRIFLADLKSIRTIPVKSLQNGFQRIDTYSGRHKESTVYAKLAAQYKELYSVIHDKPKFQAEPVSDMQNKETTRRLQQLLDRSLSLNMQAVPDIHRDDRNLPRFSSLYEKKQDINKKQGFKEQSLAQIRYHDGVYVICAINSDDIMRVQRHLAPVLNSFNASFSSAMDLFHNCGYIDAIVSSRQRGDFEDLDSIIKKDALRCGASGASFLSYERGVVRFKCDPLRLQEVCGRLKEKDYTIRKTDYGFIAKRPVYLTNQERGGYERFVKQLMSVNGLDAVYDNIKRPNKRKFVPPPEIDS